MLALIVIVAASGGLLLLNRFKYILSQQITALCWFAFLLHAVLLAGSVIAGKPMFYILE